MNDYQQEQWDALDLARREISRLSSGELASLNTKIQSYLEFRDRVDRFLNHHFSDHCNQSCYENRRSACCSKDGIVTFWADVLVNVLVSGTAELNTLERSLRRPCYDYKCTYLHAGGCRWKLRPLMCAMFLCDQVKEQVFGDSMDEIRRRWTRLNQEANSHRWPDRPVLFDHLETYFMARGVRSSLMYINTSPGLMRIKQRAGMSLPGH